MEAPTATAPARPRGRPYPKRKQVKFIEAPPKFEQAAPWRKFQVDYINDPNRLIYYVKGAQIGISTATAAWAVGECIEQDNHLVVILSRSEPQAKELARKAKLLIDKLKNVEAQVSVGWFKNTLLQEHTIKFPNGSRIIALSSNPDTARGYTGDVVLDEFAFHPQSEDIFKAAYRQVTLGYRMRIISTPNGQQGKFYEMAVKLGLADGIEPPALRQARASGGYCVRDGWSLHWTDIHRAVGEGFPVNIEEIKSGCDEETWLQEYCCQFISTAQQWITPELMEPPNIDQVVTREVADLGNNPPMNFRNLYAGWDVARHRDLSVIWFTELLGDVALCRAIFEMSKRPTPEQIREARRFLLRERTDIAQPCNVCGAKDPCLHSAPVVQRMCIDTGSMGLTIYETLLEEFGSGQIEGIDFTLAHKEAMAVAAKRRLEERKARIPDLPAVRNSFRMIKKVTTATGQARFDAEHDEKWGHGDHWWAMCLAQAAESGSTLHPLMKVWQEQYEAQRIARKELEEQPAPLPPEVQNVAVPVVLGQAQKHELVRTGVFGAEKWPGLVEMAHDELAARQPIKKREAGACPECKNPNLTIYGETVVCNRCGWKGTR